MDDVLIGHDEADQAFVSENEHFVRAIKLTLNGTSDYASGAAGTAGGELASITGLTPKADISQPVGGAGGGGGGTED